MGKNNNIHEPLEFQTQNYELYISHINKRMVSDNGKRHEYAFVPDSWNQTDNFNDKISGEKTGVVIINLHTQNTNLTEILIAFDLIPENIDTVVTVHARPVSSEQSEMANVHCRICDSNVFGNSNIIYSGIPIYKKTPKIKTSDIERCVFVTPINLPTVSVDGKLKMFQDSEYSSWNIPRFTNIYNGPLTEKNMICGARQFLAVVIEKAVMEYTLIKTRICMGVTNGERIQQKTIRQAINYLNVDGTIELEKDDFIAPFDMHDLNVIPTLMKNIDSFPEAKRIVDQAYRIASHIAIHQALVYANRPNARKSNESFKAYKERIGYPYFVKAYDEGVPLSDLLPVVN